ncbi:MarR family winged helix-turn-helix transcriptional regulator [Arthrobacter castelli]|uniref:MarR family winged helix-turn-helix transcriptional regulator n=1 Tax=Arthrobacter castelli TaxID=271431 RepID=UPI0009D69612|nr:MarR family transcriptional regulator [Arthrobacter castelli]
MSAESLELSRLLRPLLPRLYHLIRRRSPGWDMTTAQSSVITTLTDKGAMRMGTLANLEGVRLPTATSVVNGLIKLGLVERRADPDDRRAVVVDLTTQGRAEVGELAEDRNQYFARQLDRLTGEERAALEAAVPAMTRLLDLTTDRDRREAIANDERTWHSAAEIRSPETH